MIFNNKIARLINQNRKIIIIVISACVFIIILIKILNGFLMNPSNEEDETDNIDNTTKEIRESSKTITSNTTISNKTAKENYNLISNFVEYCNNRKFRRSI